MEMIMKCNSCFLAEICKLKEQLMECREKSASILAPECVTLHENCERWEPIYSQASLPCQSSVQVAHDSSLMRFGVADFCELCKNRDICAVTDQIQVDELRNILVKANGRITVSCKYFAWSTKHYTSVTAPGVTVITVPDNDPCNSDSTSSSCCSTPANYKDIF